MSIGYLLIISFISKALLISESIPLELSFRNINEIQDVSGSNFRSLIESQSEIEYKGYRPVITTKITMGNQPFEVMLMTHFQEIALVQDRPTTFAEYFFSPENSTTFSTKEEKIKFYVYGHYASGIIAEDIITIFNETFKVPFYLVQEGMRLTTGIDGFIGLSRFNDNKNFSLLHILKSIGKIDSLAFSIKFDLPIESLISKKKSQGLFYLGKHKDFFDENNKEKKINEFFSCDLLPESEIKDWGCKMSGISLMLGNDSLFVKNFEFNAVFSTSSYRITLPLELLDGIDINTLEKHGLKIEDNSFKNIEKKLISFEDKEVLEKIKLKLLLGSNELILNSYLLSYSISIIKKGIKEINTFEFIRSNSNETLVYTIGFPLFFEYHTGFDPDNNKMYFKRINNEEKKRKQLKETKIEIKEKEKPKEKKDTKEKIETKKNEEKKSKERKKEKPEIKDEEKKKEKKEKNNKKENQEIKGKDKKEKKEKTKEDLLNIKGFIDKDFIYRLIIGILLFILLCTFSVYFVKKSNRIDINKKKIKPKYSDKDKENKKDTELVNVEEK